MSDKLCCCKWVFLFLAAGFSSAVAADENAYSLCYRFQSGQFTHYEFADKAETMTQYGENQDKSIQQTQMLKSYRVIAVDEKGGATIEPIVEIVRMSSQSGGKPAVSFDSSKDEIPPKEFEKLAGTIGRPLARFQVAANGRLLKVAMIATDVPKSLSESAQKTDPAMNFLVVFPEKAVKIGEKWTEKYDTQVPVGSGLYQTMGLIRSYELVKVTSNVATIQFRTSLFTPTTDPEILRYLVTMTPTGTIEFDLNQGRIISRSLKIEEKVIEAFGKQTLLQSLGESIERFVPPQVANNAPNLIPK